MYRACVCAHNAYTNAVCVCVPSVYTNAVSFYAPNMHAHLIHAHVQIETTVCVLRVCVCIQSVYRACVCVPNINANVVCVCAPNICTNAVCLRVSNMYVRLIYAHVQIETTGYQLPGKKRVRKPTRCGKTQFGQRLARAATTAC